MKKCVKWTGLTVAVLCVVLFNGIPANAQAQNPCAEDVAKFCKDVQPGGGRLANCLQAHESELSPVCKANHDQAKAKAKEAHEACADDVQKLCKDVKPGEGRIVRCLKDNSDRLSNECRDKLMAAKKKPQ
jgi:hypothetical protein